MIPVSLEELPADLRQSATTYLAQHPSGFAARAKPRLGRDGDRWYVLHGPDTQSGIAGFGFTIEAAYESWEANYKEAVSAEQ